MRLDTKALRLARIPFDAPLCLRPSAWDSEVELPAEAPAAPAYIAPGCAYLEVLGALAEEPDTLCGWYDGYAGEDGIAARYTRAVSHDATRCAVVRFRSPGGTSAGLVEGVRQMQRARAAAGVPVLGHVEEADSAGFWLAAACCDALYIGETGQAGSIGSYVPHECIAALLAKEGVEVTLIADPPGKVAGNPYQPLSDLGRARIERGVKACTARFFAAVEASRGLDEKALRALDGDSLEGALAVNAGLVDGVVDSLETTVALALALADERIRKAA